MLRQIRALFAAAFAFSLLSSVPAATRAASFDSGVIHVETSGNGPRALIFIPGLSSGPWSWAEQTQRFSKDYTVYSLTLDGFDGRPWVPNDDLFAAFDRDFWAFVADRKIQKPVVIGHSLGGTLAIALAESHPERLAGVVALDGLPIFPALAMASQSAREAAASKTGAQVAGETHAQLLAYEVGFMRSIGTISPGRVQSLAEHCATSDPKAVGAWAQADLMHDLRPQLKNATVPIVELMPYAAPSPYTEAQTQAFYRMLLAGAPNATVEAIPNARHFAMIDQPAEVDAAITRFLATVPR